MRGSDLNLCCLSGCLLLILMVEQYMSRAMRKCVLCHMQKKKKRHRSACAYMLGIQIILLVLSCTSSDFYQLWKTQYTIPLNISSKSRSSFLPLSVSSISWELDKPGSRCICDENNYFKTLMWTYKIRKSNMRKICLTCSCTE